MLIWRNYFSSNSTDFTIGGNYFSTEFNYMEVILIRCQGKPYCKSEAEINDAINKLSLGVAITDYYFDSSDYTNSVKTNINNGLQYSLMSSFTKSVRIKVRK